MMGLIIIKPRKKHGGMESVFKRIFLVGMCLLLFAGFMPVNRRQAGGKFVEGKFFDSLPQWEIRDTLLKRYIGMYIDSHPELPEEGFIHVIYSTLCRTDMAESDSVYAGSIYKINSVTDPWCFVSSPCFWITRIKGRLVCFSVSNMYGYDFDDITLEKILRMVLPSVYTGYQMIEFYCVDDSDRLYPQRKFPGETFVNRLRNSIPLIMMENFYGPYYLMYMDGGYDPKLGRCRTNSVPCRIESSRFCDQTETYRIYSYQGAGPVNSCDSSGKSVVPDSIPRRSLHHAGLKRLLEEYAHSLPSAGDGAILLEYGIMTDTLGRNIFPNYEFYRSYYVTDMEQLLAHPIHWISDAGDKLICFSVMGLGENTLDDVHLEKIFRTAYPLQYGEARRRLHVDDTDSCNFMNLLRLSYEESGLSHDYYRVFYFKEGEYRPDIGGYCSYKNSPERHQRISVMNNSGSEITYLTYLGDSYYKGGVYDSTIEGEELYSIFHARISLGNYANILPYHRRLFVDEDFEGYMAGRKLNFIFLDTSLLRDSICHEYGCLRQSTYRKAYLGEKSYTLSQLDSLGWEVEYP